MKRDASCGRVFRERKVDVHRSLSIVRDLSELDDVQERQALKAFARGGAGAERERGRSNGSAAASGASTSCIEVPKVRAIAPGREAARAGYVHPKRYLTSEATRAGDDSRMEYDLDESDEAWLDAGRSDWLREEDLERILIKLEFALCAALRARGSEPASPLGCPAAERLSQECALDILSGHGLSGFTGEQMGEVYRYWASKRDAAGRPLLRCLQLPPAMDDASPYDLFCGRDRRSKRTKFASASQEGARLGHIHLWRHARSRELGPADLPPSLRASQEDRAGLVHVCLQRAHSGEGLRPAILLEGMRSGFERVRHRGTSMRPHQFLRMLGLDPSAARHWKSLLRVMADGEPGPSLAEWLRAGGKRLGTSVFGRVVSIWDPRAEAFQSGMITDFDRTTGKHLVRYLCYGLADTWLHLPMERVRWLPANSGDFGVQVVKRVGRRSPLRGGSGGGRGGGQAWSFRIPAASQLAHSKPPRDVVSLLCAKKALQFQLKCMRAWVGAASRAASRIVAAGARLPSRAAGRLAGKKRPLEVAEGGGASVEGAAAAALADAAAGLAGTQEPENLPILAGGRRGTLVSGYSRSDEVVVIHEGREVPPLDFMRKSARSAPPPPAEGEGEGDCWDNWMAFASVDLGPASRTPSPSPPDSPSASASPSPPSLAGREGSPGSHRRQGSGGAGGSAPARGGPSVGDWLRARGHEKGKRAVGLQMEVYWPGNGTFSKAAVIAFDRMSGRHLVQYAQGGNRRQWLYLSMHLIRWQPRRLARAEPRGAGVNAAQAHAVGAGGQCRSRKRLRLF